MAKKLSLFHLKKGVILKKITLCENTEQESLKACTQWKNKG